MPQVETLLCSQVESNERVVTKVLSAVFEMMNEAITRSKGGCLLESAFGSGCNQGYSLLAKESGIRFRSAIAQVSALLALILLLCVSLSKTSSITPSASRRVAESKQHSADDDL